MRAYVARLLTPSRATPAHEGAQIAAELSAVDLGAVSLVYGRSDGDELHVQNTEFLSYYDVHFAVTGHNLLECEDGRVLLDHTTAGIISPRMRADMRLSDGYSQLHLRIERFALEGHLERMLGQPVPGPVRFQPRMDLTVPALASWERLVGQLVQDLGSPTGLSAGGGGALWGEFLISGLLLAQPHNYSDQLARRQAGSGRPPSVRRVIELIEDDPAGDLSLPRLAQVAGVGPRSLQRHFRDFMGVSPREYVEHVRLSRAHHDLLAGAGSTVAEIAFRWGFGHVSRFAGAYRARYGVPPSQTLRSACRPAGNGI
ncbi:AraC family transcriptional regulator [Streptomyces graminofaciens]|nr:AraC family transcriptional regulator [Streptomyces graminofaciens]